MSNLENINKEIEDLEKNLEDLKNIANGEQINLNDVDEIQKKIENLKKQAYSKMTAWDKVNLARNPQRPTALDYIDRIFDEFYTVDISRTKGNTGLGLAIAKEFVEQLNGDIKAVKEKHHLKIVITFKTSGK